MNIGSRRRQIVSKVVKAAVVEVTAVVEKKVREGWSLWRWKFLVWYLYVGDGQGGTYEYSANREREEHRARDDT